MRTYKVVAIIVLSISMMSCNQKVVGEVDQLNTKIDSVSYALGLTYATGIKQGFEEFNQAVFYQGLNDKLNDDKKLMDEKNINVFLNKFFSLRQAKIREKQLEEKFGDNRIAGEKFLAENKTKEGVITTESGLQYKILKEGTGAKVKPENKIKIHYHGTTIKGEVFDSTIEKNKPYEAKANVFVPGFNEALTLMNKGAKYKVFIPQELGYASRQAGKLIPPFSALVFEIEILEIIE